MRWRALIVVAAVAAAVFATASPALAKGPDQATITGPGLANPIVVGGNGEPGSGDKLGELADGSGLFAFIFGGTSGVGKRIAQPPAGDLGSKFELTYRIPDGSTSGSTFHQDLYPSAPGGPVTFAYDGQKVFGNDVVGGWYRPPSSFAALLAALRVPGSSLAASPVSTSSQSTAGNTTPIGAASGGGHGWVIGLLIGAVILVALGLVTIVARARKRTAAEV